jgi:exodeoxyribonuclease VII large subunit
MAFNTEQVAIAVANSKIPIVVGVGHEEDITLADLAADVRAATPTHAAGLIVPSKQDIFSQTAANRQRLTLAISQQLLGLKQKYLITLKDAMERLLIITEQSCSAFKRSLKAYDPQTVLSRGYAVLKIGSSAIVSVKQVTIGDNLEATIKDGTIKSEVKDVQSSQTKH